MKKLFTAILTAALLFTFNLGNAQTLTGTMITFHTPSGPDAKAHYIPATGTAAGKVLIVFSDWNGLTTDAKKDAEQWFTAFDGDVTVYAVDIFDGRTSVGDFEGQAMKNSLDAARAEAIVAGLIQHIGSGKMVATIGYGVGGTWAFNASASLGTDAAGCTIFYGFPVTDASRIAMMRTDVRFMLGYSDEYITYAQAETFGQQITAAGRDFKLQTFSHKHGFANNGNANYHSIGVSETKYLTTKFLKHTLAL